MRVYSIILVLAFFAALGLMLTDANAAPPQVAIQLTYPSGQSPKVFTTGWLFGAKATVGGKDISNQVKWSGSGKFSPSKGPLSRPSFKKPGANTIVLSVDYAGKHFSKKFSIKAVSPDKYAAMGDFVTCPSDAHNCPACPHSVKGTINQGSPQVLVRGKPAARKGDGGHHTSCCGPNTFKISEGDSGVLINGKPAARKGDTTTHCGGVGQINNAQAHQGAEEVFSGPAGPSSSLKLIIVNSVVKGEMTATQPGVRSSGTISGSYDRKSGKITAQIKGSTRVSIGGESGGSTWSGPLNAKRTGDVISGTFTMTVRSGSTSMSDNVPVKLKKTN
jgi:uncharacterized Zn-binding protein involved in type VI secretion